MKLSKVLEEIDRTDRLRLAVVFVVALAVISLETVAFQAICFVNEYLQATQVISAALVGIALGGLLAYFFGSSRADRNLGPVLILLPFSVLASFPVIARMNDEPFLMMAVLAVPFVLASIVISATFNRLRPSAVYLADLVGAGIGAVLAVVVIPLLREEGSFFLIALVASLAPLLHWRVRRRTGEGGAAVLAAGVVVLLVAGGLLIAHVARDPFNMIWFAQVDREEYPEKVFNYVWNKDRTEKRYHLHHSRGSLIERIDILERKREKRTGRLNSVYNGRFVDVITSYVMKKKGDLDNRLPTRLKLGEDPDTLLVGPSGQGLTKAVQTMGDGHVDAVEINGAIARLMTNELWKASGYAYDRMDLTIGDVRTFAARTDREYDFITMLNTHRVYSIAHQGPPEYVHTIEAMKEYLAHLKEDGFILFEERNGNERADLGIKRIIKTAQAALRETGAKNPNDHLVVWEVYQRCKKRFIFEAPEQCNRAYRFTFVMIKRTPLERAEIDHLVEWAEIMGARKQISANYPFRGIKWAYLPGKPMENDWTEAIEAGSLYDIGGYDPAVHNLGTVTDDVPFPYDVFTARVEPWRILESTALLALLMVLLPAIATFAARRRGSGEARPLREMAGANLLLIAYFSVLGIGYLLVEIVLLQKFGIFLSSPVYSLVVVLATMLVSSGVGGYFSHGIDRRKALMALGAVVALIVVSRFAYSHVLDALMFLPFPARAAAAIALIAPLGFFMGMPFPYAMARAKELLTERHAGLMFGINGAVAAVATPVSILLSMMYGFDFTVMVGGAAYLVCIPLLAAVRRHGAAA